MTDLEKVSAEVFDLYQRNRYEEALEVARGVAAEFPARSSYWTACLLAVQGKGQEALDALTNGLRHGAWWPSLMLEQDSDLDSIRDSPEFARIEAESTSRWRQAFRPEPNILIYQPSASPSGVLLIALHGSAGEPATDFAQHWNAARDQGAFVVVPQSSQPYGPEGGWTWADDDRTKRDLRLVYDRARQENGIDPDKVILSGFSQGGRVAISSAVTHYPISVSGFIAVAPAVRDHPIADQLGKGGPSIRGWITVGQNDWVLEPATSLHEAAISQSQDWHLDIVPNVAHDFPLDFDDHLIEALAFITTRS